MAKQQLTPEQAQAKIIKQREQNRLRQMVYYEKHKQDILDKKKQERTELKILAGRAKPIEKPIIQPEKVYEQPIVYEEVVEPVVPVIKEKVKGKAKKEVYSYERVSELLSQIPDITPGSLKKYKSDIKTLMEVIECNNLVKCLSKPKKVLELISNAKYVTKPTEDYSINSKKGFVQSIIYVIDQLNIPLKKSVLDEYRKYLELYKLKSSDERNEIQKNITKMNYNDYLKLLSDKFGQESKEYLIGQIYNELPARDNLNNLKIVSTENGLNDKDNYLVVPRSGNCIFIINEYKTKNKGQIKVKTTPLMSNLIKNYIKKNEITDILFGKGKLSQFVIKMNTLVGIQGKNNGINYLRHMKTSSVYNSNATDMEKVELAQKMGHSVGTQKTYVHKIK